MIDIDKARKEFIKYAKKYDLKDSNIMMRFHHSFRVVEIAQEIVESLKLNKEDFNLVTTIALFHDIARFEQWTKYKTFSDRNSIDHGDLGVKILLEDGFIDSFVDNEKEKNIILIAIKNHNKYAIENNLNEKELLMCQIIRDADKLDILREYRNFLTGPQKVNVEIIDSFEKNILTNYKLMISEADGILGHLSYIFDLNFKYSFEFILKNKIVENKINLLENYCDNVKLIEKINNILNIYIKERCE